MVIGFFMVMFSPFHFKINIDLINFVAIFTSISTPEVKDTSISDESIKEADRLYEQFSLLQTCISDKILASGVWLLRTCKFMLMARILVCTMNDIMRHIINQTCTYNT